MRTIDIIIDKNGFVKTNGTMGFKGEHNARILNVVFEDEMPDVPSYRMIFSSKDGSRAFTTGLISPVGNSLTYNIPRDITELGDTVFWQLMGISLDNSIVSVLAKSEVVSLSVGSSIADTVNYPDTDVTSSIETAALELNSFLQNFDITSSITPSTDKNFSFDLTKGENNKYNLNLSVPNNIPLGTIIHSDDLDTDTLYGNGFMPHDKTNQKIVFYKIGNLVTVMGAVYYSSKYDHGHTESSSNQVVLYLPFKPTKILYSYMFETSGNNISVPCRTNHTNSTYSYTGSVTENKTYSVMFSYVSE